MDPALSPSSDATERRAGRPVEPTKRSRTRIAFASMSGTLIEGYDFIIYGTAAALVFPHIFFPALGEAASTVASLATFGVAFIARPFGSILFGHFGDRLGRKKTLVTTLVMMGSATCLIGLIPPASQIGVAAPIILILLRVVQGVSAGGEWAGATLFATEHAPADKRGLWAMFPQIGATLPLPLASATFLLTGMGMSNEAFTSWGWRIPFLASALLIAIGLWVRLKIDETPVFKREQARAGRSAIPFFEAFKSQPREVLKAAGVALTTFSFVYVSSSYLTNYATKTLELSRNQTLVASVIGGLVYTLAVVVSALASDRIGRKPVIGAANAVAILWALMLFPILNMRSVLSFSIAISVTFFIAGLVYGPLGAFLPELFQTRYRYTATGLSYNLTAVVGGGIAPLLAPAVIGSAGPLAFGAFLACLCLVATLCTLSLRETRNAALEDSTV